jgi:hypothetical protein
VIVVVVVVVLLLLLEANPDLSKTRSKLFIDKNRIMYYLAVRFVLENPSSD